MSASRLTGSATGRRRRSRRCPRCGCELQRPAPGERNRQRARDVVAGLGRGTRPCSGPPPAARRLQAAGHLGAAEEVPSRRRGRCRRRSRPAARGLTLHLDLPPSSGGAGRPSTSRRAAAVRDPRRHRVDEHRGHAEHATPSTASPATVRRSRRRRRRAARAARGRATRARRSRHDRRLHEQQPPEARRRQRGERPDLPPREVHARRGERGEARRARAARSGTRAGDCTPRQSTQEQEGEPAEPQRHRQQVDARRRDPERAWMPVLEWSLSVHVENEPDRAGAARRPTRAARAGARERRARANAAVSPSRTTSACPNRVESLKSSSDGRKIPVSQPPVAYGPCSSRSRSVAAEQRRRPRPTAVAGPRRLARPPGHSRSRKQAPPTDSASPANATARRHRVRARRPPRSTAPGSPSPTALGAPMLKEKPPDTGCESCRDDPPADDVRAPPQAARERQHGVPPCPAPPRCRGRDRLARGVEELDRVRPEVDRLAEARAARAPAASARPPVRAARLQTRYACAPAGAGGRGAAAKHGQRPTGPSGRAFRSHPRR